MLTVTERNDYAGRNILPPDPLCAALEGTPGGRRRGRPRSPAAWRRQGRGGPSGTAGAACPRRPGPADASSRPRPLREQPNRKSRLVSFHHVSCARAIVEMN